MLPDYCDVTVTGGNPYPFVNALRQSPVACAEQEIRGEEFRFRIRTADLPETQQIAEAFHMELTVHRRRSVERRLRRYRLRFGIPIGLLLGALLILWRSNVVESIEIQGNSVTPDTVILSLLADCGVRRGTWIPGIDMHEKETYVRTNVTDLAWVGIRHTGNRLVVEVTEVQHPPEMVHERTPCNIVSLYDAQITSVEVHSGMLMRLVGDGVSKGELLVSGILQDETGHTSWRHADARIIGVYRKETELTENFTNTETRLTGQSMQQRWLRLFGLYLPLTLRAPDYPESTVSEYETPICFLGHTLPCAVVLRTTEETVTQSVTRSREDTQRALNEAMKRYETNFLSDVTILDCTQTLTETPEGFTCRLQYMVEGEIGEARDFYVK